MLEEPAFNEATWQALADAKDPKDVKAATAYPVVQVVVGATKAFVDKAPAIHAFLKNYRTTGQQVSEALAFMQETKGTPDDAARNFLKTREDVWGAWVAPAVAARVKAKL